MSIKNNKKNKRVTLADFIKNPKYKYLRPKIKKQVKLFMERMGELDKEYKRRNLDLLIKIQANDQKALSDLACLWKGSLWHEYKNWLRETRQTISTKSYSDYMEYIRSASFEYTKNHPLETTPLENVWPALTTINMNIKKLFRKERLNIKPSVRLSKIYDDNIEQSDESLNNNLENLGVESYAKPSYFPQTYSIKTKLIENKEYVYTQTVAEIAGRSQRTIEDWTKKGYLKAIKEIYPQTGNNTYYIEFPGLDELKKQLDAIKNAAEARMKAGKKTSKIKLF